MFPDFAAALAHAATLCEDAESGGGTIAVIGGGEIYRHAMPRADRLEITEVHAAPEGDVTFPAIDPATWRPASREPHPAGEKDDHTFTFVTYLRR